MSDSAFEKSTFGHVGNKDDKWRDHMQCNVFKPQRICVKEGCEKNIYGNNFCKAHYKEWFNKQAYAKKHGFME